MKSKRSLGQNFLKSKKVLAEIIAVANLSPEDTVLEVGPGEGVLTEALLETGSKVVAVEKGENILCRKIPSVSGAIPILRIRIERNRKISSTNS